MDITPINEQLPTKYELTVKSFRALPNPFGEYSESSKNPVVYECYVEIQDIPSDFPMWTNPREQSLTTQVAKSIKESLETDLGNFQIKNRGIVVSAESVAFNTRSSVMTINMTDFEVHGNIDGGHTYRIILDNRADIVDPRYVRLEIIIGAEDFFQDLAKARNTSVQVKDNSIAELEKKFELIKEPLKNVQGMDLNKHIAFKENEGNKRISVENIISILYNFNIDDFSDAERQPISTYSQKSYCLKQYIKFHNEMGDTEESKKANPFYKMQNIIPEILTLYDHIESTLNEKYRESDGKGRYGALKGIQSKKEGSDSKFKTEVLDRDLEFKSPRSFVLPILSSFRALVAEDENGFYKFEANPFEYYEDLGSQMIKNTVERSRTLGNNPNALGKDTGHWRDLYNLVDLEYKNILIQKLMGQSKHNSQ